MVRYFALPFFLLIFSSTLSYAQIPRECGSLKYENHNNIDPEPLEIKNIKGSIMAKNDPDRRFFACLGVFEETSGKLVKVVYLDFKQKFEFKDIPEGKYRLVVKEKNGFFCTANIPVKVNRKSSRKRKIAVVMSPPEIDTCSYGEIKK